MAGSWNGTQYTGDDTFETVNGTAADEGINGRGGDDQLFGGGGNDRVTGGTGSDRIEGGSGNDTLNDTGDVPFGFVGLIGRDSMFGGLGNDELIFQSVDTSDIADGGEGTDLLRVFLSPPYANLPFNTPISFTLGPNGASSIIQVAGVDTLTVMNIERLVIFTGDGADFLAGAAGDDALFGGAGNDALYGGGGNDFLDGGTGVQGIYGGDGIDGASFDLSGAIDGLTITNAAPIALGALGEILGIEYLDDISTGSGADNITINQSQFIYITSNSGADVITVGDGGSEIYAGGGADNLTLGAGFDEVYGGEGNNVARLGGNGDIYRHETRLDTGNENVSGEGGDDRIATASGNDSVYGGIGDDEMYTGWGDDLGSGGNGDDELDGEDGADTLYGGAGNDTVDGDDDTNSLVIDAKADLVYGGEGNDKLVGGQGADQLFGGLGNDTLSLIPLADVGLDSGTDTVQGGTGNDVLGLNLRIDTGLVLATSADFQVQIGSQLIANVQSIEALSVSISGAGNNRLTGGNLADVLRTDTGNDRLIGNNGNDTLGGNTGSDTLFGGSGNDAVNNHYLGGRDLIDTGIGNDDVTIFVPWSSSPLDPGLSTLRGGDGTDVLTIYTSDRASVFDGTVLTLGGVDVAIISGFEVLRLLASGSANASLTGGSGNDSLRGSNGNDLLTGLAGADTADGGIGNDTLQGGTGDDSLIGGAGANLLSGDVGNDSITITFDGLTDIVRGGLGSDRLVVLPSFVALPVVMSGSLDTGATLVRGGVTEASITGIEAIEISVSGATNDTLIGGNSDDVITAGGGADRVNTGAGDDFVWANLDAAGSDTLNLGIGTADRVQLSLSGLTGGVSFTLAATGVSVARVDGVARASVSGAEAAVIWTGAGNDQLQLLGGNDSVSLGTGADLASMGAGNDSVNISVDSLRDTLSGGAGQDILSLNAFSVAGLRVLTDAAGVIRVLVGGVVVAEATAFEQLTVFGSTDLVQGDSVVGGAGADSLSGFAGNDTLVGAGGNDALFGGSEADVITAGIGSDTLGGETGSDTLTGGAGADAFRFVASDHGVDRITDFGADDRLEFVTFGFAPFQDEGFVLQLIKGTAPTPTTDDPVLLYNTTTGALSWDRDGNGGAEAILLARLFLNGSAANIMAAQIDLI